MIYVILAALLMIGLRMFFYLKRCQEERKQRGGREFFCILFSADLGYLFYQFLNKPLEEPMEQIFVILWFIPLGIFMPLLFWKCRYLLINIMLAALFSTACILLRMVRHIPFQPILILYAVFGVLLGFVVCKILREVFPVLKKGFYIEKKRKKKRNEKRKNSLVLQMEAELTGLSMLGLVFLISFGMDFVASFQKKPEVMMGVIQKEEYHSAYEKTAYAVKAHYDRYIAYQLKHPDYDADETVWRVEANLDQEFYDEDYITYVDETTSNPLLINKFNGVSEQFRPKNLVKVEGNYEATKETAEAFQIMKKDLEAEGMKIYVVSAYRTIAYQKNLYQKYLKEDTKENVDSYSARPGFSEHHTGRALDISQVMGNLNVFEGSKEAKWIYENAYKYGFIVRYPENGMDVTGYIYEPWHITYVGEQIAGRMHEEKIETLEEYVVKYGQ